MPALLFALIAMTILALPSARAATRAGWAVEPAQLQSGARVCDATYRRVNGELRLRLDHASTRILLTLPDVTAAPALMSLEIDGQKLDDLRISGMDGGAIAASVPLAGSLFTRMMQGRRLVVSAAGQSLDVPLAGVSGTIDRLYSCVSKLR